MNQPGYRILKKYVPFRKGVLCPGTVGTGTDTFGTGTVMINTLKVCHQLINYQSLPLGHSRL